MEGSLGSKGVRAYVDEYTDDMREREAKWEEKENRERCKCIVERKV